MARTRNMRVKPRMYMGKTPLRMSLYGFKVTASRDDVEAFADQWPGSGMHGKGGFSAEFDKNGDLVDLSGWAADFRGDQSALSALIDDMKAFGLAHQGRAGNRKRNPATRGRKRRRITSKAQFRRLAAMATRGEISRRDFRDMVAASRPYASLPARKGAARKRRKSRRQSRRRGRR